jgi:hypothetical protein
VDFWGKLAKLLANYMCKGPVFIRRTAPLRTIQMPGNQNVTTYPRNKIERRVLRNGFRDYEGLAQWVRDPTTACGAMAIRSSRTRVSALQAAAVAGLRDARGAVAQTLLTIAQQKALASLFEREEIKPAVINALARMISEAQASTAASVSSSVSPSSAQPAPEQAPTASGSAQLNPGSARLDPSTAQLNPGSAHFDRGSAHFDRGSAHFNPPQPGSPQIAALQVAPPADTGPADTHDATESANAPVVCPWQSELTR